MSTGNHGHEQRIRSFLACYWWLRNPAIKPVEVGSLSHYVQGFFTSQVVRRISEPVHAHSKSACFLLQLWLVLKADVWLTLLNLLAICCHYSARTFMIVMVYSGIIYLIGISWYSPQIHDLTNWELWNPVEKSWTYQPWNSVHRFHLNPNINGSIPLKTNMAGWEVISCFFHRRYLAFGKGHQDINLMTIIDCIPNTDGIS